MADEYRTERISSIPLVQEFGHEHDFSRRRPPAHYGAAPPSPHERSEHDVASVLGLPVGALGPEVLAAVMRLLAEMDRLREQGESWHRREQAAEDEADRDPVVPCLNRRAFGREVENYLRSGADGVVAVLHVAGIEALRRIHGLAAGEGALRHAAAMILGQLRRTDLVALLGGSDFAVLFPATPADKVREKLSSLETGVNTPAFTWMGQVVTLELLWGFYVLAPGDTAEHALAEADRHRRRLG